MKKRGFSARGLFVLIFLAGTPLFANTDYTVLLDLDNNSATGCTVTTAAGTFIGADQRVITTVSSSTPLMVISVVREVCIAAPSTWGSSAPLNSPYATPWLVGDHNGTGGLDVIETYLPLTGIPQGFYRLGFISSAGAGDALLTVSGTPAGAPIQIGNFAAGALPTLGAWMLIALAATLLVVGLVIMRAPHGLSIFIAVLLIVTFGARVAWATLIPDGDPSGWAGVPPLATRTPVPAAGSANIGAVFGTILNNVLLLRIDADVPRAATVTTQPVSTTVVSGNNASFTSTATGSPAPTVQWQSSPDGSTWTDIPGATSTTLTFTASLADDQKQYRAMFTNIAGSVASNPATLTVVTLPTITTQPVNTTVAPSTSASFTSAATASPAPTVQWQSSPDGSTWTDIAGATSTTLTFTATAADDAKQYRAVFTNTAGSVVSNPAYLFVQTSMVASLPFADNFNRADGQPQGPWIMRSGDFTIAGNQIVAASTLVNVATLNGVSSSNTIVQADVSNLADGQFAALVAHHSGPAGTNMYYGGVRNTGGTFTAEIWKNVAGTPTQLVTQTLTPAQFTGTGTLKLNVVGTSLTLTSNGTPLTSATDGTLGAGSDGLLATPGVAFDNFVAQ